MLQFGVLVVGSQKRQNLAREYMGTHVLPSKVLLTGFESRAQTRNRHKVSWSYSCEAYGGLKRDFERFYIAPQSLQERAK